MVDDDDPVDARVVGGAREVDEAVPLVRRGRTSPKFGEPDGERGRGITGGHVDRQRDARRMSRDDVPMRSSNSPGSTVQSCALDVPERERALVELRA